MAAEQLSNILVVFEGLKERLDLSALTGLPLFEALKLKLGTQKTWKARDVLDLLDKRAKQKEFMGQVSGLHRHIVNVCYPGSVLCTGKYVSTVGSYESVYL